MSNCYKKTGDTLQDTGIGRVLNRFPKAQASKKSRQMDYQIKKLLISSGN
jgi:hypothetical protein